MTGPITRPLEVENDAIPSYPLPGIHANDRSSISSNIRNDNSVNRTMPWVALAMLIAGIGLGMGVSAYVSSRDAVQSLERRYETDRKETLTKVQLLDNHVNKLINQVDVVEKVYASDRRR